MQATAVKGKYPYFSPEQARGEAVDFRTDLYATGVVLYEMLCGRLPHLGKMVQAMQSIIRGEFPSPRSLNPRLSPELEATVLRAMAHASADRFASAQELEHALADALHALGPRPPTLGDFMSFLFEPELLAQGHEVRLPRALLEHVPEWRKGTRPEEPIEAVPSVTTAAVRPPPPARTTPWKLVALLGVALLLGTILAAVLGRAQTFEVELLSEPTGASVEVDGTPVPGTTPLRITHLGADQPHQLHVKLAGRSEWTGEITGRSGTTVHLRAELPAAPQVPGDSPDSALTGPPPPGTPRPPPAFVLAPGSQCKGACAGLGSWWSTTSPWWRARPAGCSRGRTRSRWHTADTRPWRCSSTARSTRCSATS